MLVTKDARSQPAGGRGIIQEMNEITYNCPARTT